jgi:hypothetical protein
MSLEGKRTLIFAILKFLREELKQENITADVKESLEGKTALFRFFVVVISMLDLHLVI